MRLGASDQDVVDGDVDQLDNVANNTHDQETHPDGLRDAQELALVGLAAPGDELAAVLDELARHLEEFLGLVHCCWCVWCVWYVCCVGFVRVFGSFALLVWLLEGVGMASLVCLQRIQPAARVEVSF